MSSYFPDCSTLNCFAFGWIPAMSAQYLIQERLRQHQTDSKDEMLLATGRTGQQQLRSAYSITPATLAWISIS
eukprot:747668-Hanusia_phi.AAC.2